MALHGHHFTPVRKEDFVWVAVCPKRSVHNLRCIARALGEIYVLRTGNSPLQFSNTYQTQVTVPQMPEDLLGPGFCRLATQMLGLVLHRAYRFSACVESFFDSKTNQRQLEVVQAWIVNSSGTAYPVAIRLVPENRLFVCLYISTISGPEFYKVQEVFEPSEDGILPQLLMQEGKY